MSLSTWKSEFYPVEAIKAATDPVTAAKHSLRKWEGVRRENLERHGLIQIRHQLAEDERVTLTIDDTTCALCQWAECHGDEQCLICPLGRVSKECSRESSPWRKAVSATEPDPEPLIAALKKAVEYAEAHA